MEGGSCQTGNPIATSASTARCADAGVVDSNCQPYPRSPHPVPDLPSNAAYTKRFNAVLAYIDANLKGGLCEDVEPSGELFGVSLPSTIHRLRGRACFALCTVDAATTRSAWLVLPRGLLGTGSRAQCGLRKPRSIFPGIQAGVRLAWIDRRRVHRRKLPLAKGQLLAWTV